MNRRRFKITRGLDIPLRGQPERVLEDGSPVKRVALLGIDYPIRAKLDVAEGDVVALGQPLFHDKHDPRIRFTAPGAGVVETVRLGPRRALRAVIVRLEGDAERTFEPLEQPTAEAATALLLDAGLWSSFRTRPFDRVANPDRRPAAIFVSAMDTQPLALGPQTLLAERGGDFNAGLGVLATLTDTVHVCTGEPLALDIRDDVPAIVTEFAGPHPAGLPGTHIHHLAPASQRRLVWYVSADDVVAIGHLARTGHILTERIVTVAGPMARAPRQLRTRLGAALDELLEGELLPGPTRIVSGSPLGGHTARGWSAFLGRYHRQISLLPDDDEREFMDFMRPGLDQYSATNAYISSVLPPARGFALKARLNGSRRALVPIGNLESVMPLDLLPAPLLKALIVRDTETARALGCLELGEEDMALMTFVCPSKIDYGAHLRACLDIIEREG